MIEEFERHLRGTNLSENTISSYLFAIRQYSSQYDGITKKNLRAYKVWLIENYKPKTVNLRLRAINCYLESIGKESWKMPFVRVQQKAFLENVISEADYEYFKTCLKRDDELFWYFVIRFLAATGARVSELIQIKVEHGIEETLTYCDFPSEHWTRIRTNNVIERLNREIRRRTRVVGTFPDGNSALMLVCARLRHVAGTQWGNKKYMNMKHLEATLDDVSIAG